MEGEGEGPIEYGDLRLQADRRLGCCLFWVRSTALALPSTTASTAPIPGLSPLRSLSLFLSQVVPDVSQGFYVPSIYAGLREQVADDRAARRREAERRRRDCSRRTAKES
jgi:hypothetical protein